jgi:tetratricopeptide (TPR) repeat protein
MDFHDDLTPGHALLLAWLAADTAADRQHLLDASTDMLTPHLADDLIALAAGGPSYGGDREAEARFQLQLLELAVAVADHVGAPETRSEAQRLLAASLADLPGSEEQRAEVLEAAVVAARLAGRWETAYRAQLDLARLKQALGRGREALLAYEQALALALTDAALVAEAEEALDAVVRLAHAMGRPSAAKAAIERFMGSARTGGDRLRLGHAANTAGRHLIGLGLDEEAGPWLHEAVALLGEMGDDDALARAHLRLLALSFASGDVVGAARHVEEVIRLHARVADPALLAEIEEQFGQFF